MAIGYFLSYFWGPVCSLTQGPASAPVPWGRGKREGGEEGVGYLMCTISLVCTQSSPEEQLLSFSIIYTVGYTLSFSALVIASAILLSFR